MRYIIPRFDCVLMGQNKNYNLCANVKYCVENVENLNFLIISNFNNIPYSVNFLSLDENDKVVKVKHNNDEYLFLLEKPYPECELVQIKFLNNIVSVSLFTNLCIGVDGKILLEKEVKNIKYSSYEIVGELCIIYFKGKRNFVVVLKQTEVLCASFYDECNVENGEKYFMCKLKDSLNHGRVFHIKDKTFETYLVYLDDYDLNLKQIFIGNVFLDCALAENFKYCNQLFCNELKQKDEGKIKDFILEFDYYYPINESEFILLKKNTLAGIYKFEYSNNSISNIIQLA